MGDTQRCDGAFLLPRPSPIVMTPTSKLSHVQKRILLTLVALSADIAPGRDGKTRVPHHALRSAVEGDEKEPTVSRAAFGKALARLEGRGLLTQERGFDAL